MAPPTELRIGLFGHGTVGSGVYSLIHSKQSYFKSLGLSIKIVKVCVTSLDKHATAAGVAAQHNVEFVTSYESILNDKSINCIIELIGGVTDAKEIVFQAISKDKHVITGNKALIATFMTPLLQLLEQHPSVQFGYEASVCGGIPIIHTLQDSFVSDNITQLIGIMNGTTNYMLTKMSQEGVSYDEVLKEAQALGYAEANPSADVDGLDVQAKLSILVKLAFGTSVSPTSIPTVGITRVSAIDFEYATRLSSTIKLLGVARKEEGTLTAYVAPVMVPLTHSSQLGTCHGATNLVSIQSANMTQSSFIGQGAGQLPTANSVLSDVIQLSRGVLAPHPFPQHNDPKSVAASLVLQTDFTSRFYIRVTILNQVGILRVVGSCAEVAGVSVHAILQLPMVNVDSTQPTDVVITTELSQQRAVKNMCEALEKESFVLSPPFCCPILD